MRAKLLAALAVPADATGFMGAMRDTARNVPAGAGTMDLGRVLK